MSMNLTITAELNDLSIGISVSQTPTGVTHKILEQPNIKASFEVYREYMVSMFGEKDGNRSYNNLRETMPMG